MNRLTTDPLKVLISLCQVVKAREGRSDSKGLKLWSTAVWGPTLGNSGRATISAARVIQSICVEIDKLSADRNDSVEDLWLSSLDGEMNIAEFEVQLSKALSSSDEHVDKELTKEEVVLLRDTVDGLIIELSAVTDPTQSALCAELIEFLKMDVIPAIQRSIELKVWLLRQELFNELSPSLLTYGMRLNASGNTALAERVFLVALSTTSIIAGLANPILGVGLGAASLLTTVKSPSELVIALTKKPKNGNSN